MQDRGAYLEQRIVLSFFVSSGRAFVNGIICVRCVLLSMMRGLGWWRAAVLRAPLYNSAGLRCVYRARPCATRRSLTAATARLQVAPRLLHQPHSRVVF